MRVRRQSRPSRPLAAVAAAAALATSSSLLVGVAVAGSAGAVSPDVVVSEVYGGGGNSGATFRNDFVELYNRGTSAVSVDGWSVQYASATGTSYAVTRLAGSIAPGGRYLVQQAAGANTAATPLPTPDATGNTAMSAESGKVALVASRDALSGTDIDDGPTVRDFVGYGSANDFEDNETGPGPAPRLLNTTSASRASSAADTDVNSTDFASGAPTPQNSGSPSTPPPPPPPPPAAPSTTIEAIQGRAHQSPQVGATVTDVQGVVTAVRSNGFWFQTTTPDADPGTAAGLFVFTNSAPTVRVGDAVAVDGRVSEFRPGGSGSANLSTTQIIPSGATAVTVTSAGNALPAPTVIGRGGRVPPNRVIEDDTSGDIETAGGNDFDPAQDGIDFYESLEGMRVSVNDPVAAGPSNDFGEIPVLTDGGADAGVRSVRGGVVIQPGDFNPERIFLDDLLIPSGSMPAADTGDTLGQDQVGVVDYSFGNYKVLVTAVPTVQRRDVPREVTAAQGQRELAVATFNVENLDPSDPQDKYDRLARTIVTNLAAPDVIAVEEVQDNNGAVNDAVVDADVTWRRLIAAISAAGGPAYDYRDVDPVDDQDGGEPGGNIRVGFLFRTDSDDLEFVDRPGGDSTTRVQVVPVGNSGKARLSASPGRIDPTNPAFARSRKPLVGEFTFRGRTVFVIANHWNSKGGDDPLFGRYQPPALRSEAQRLQQAKVVGDFVDTLQRVERGSSRAVVAGDLNDFEFSRPVRQLVEQTGLIDLPATLPLPERYTYVFEGNSQVLDHILISPALATLGYAYDVVHVNADYADQVSDHDPQVARLRVK